jgi:FAD:protein FMN transferase
MTSVELRRCRPQLGTFVAISARGPDRARLERAMTAAFDTIARLQALLCTHDAGSELSRLNRQVGSAPLQVGTHLWRVLRTAAGLARETDGAFDATLGSGGFELLAGRRVRLAPGARLDLGGIAKGYCVDRAVQALRRRGARAGLVNAGGDLRAFGDAAYPLHLRHPGDARRLVALGELRESALATSASYGAGNDRRSLRRGADLTSGLSISVRAPSAMLADALTKVVARLGDGAAPLLERYRAHAWAMAAA